MATEQKTNAQVSAAQDPAPTIPATPAGTAPEIAPRESGTGRGGWAEQTIRTVRGVLPSSRLPVYLAGTALLVTGFIDPPVAVGAGLAYEALRRWEPRGTA